jgi:hypothetical protein
MGRYQSRSMAITKALRAELLSIACFAVYFTVWTITCQY